MRTDSHDNAGRYLRLDPLNRLPLAIRLDREADAELQAGHHGRAEHLAHRAEALRMIGADRLAPRT